MSTAVRLASLVPETDREQIAAESRELAARVQQPLEQELAAVDAVINEFSEVMSRDFGPLAKFATRRGKPAQDDAI